MPKYTEDWYEDRVPFALEEIPALELRSKPVFEMVKLDPRELQKSQEVGRAAWQRYRDEIEEQIKSVFAPLGEMTLDDTEIAPFLDWMKYGVARYGYDDSKELTDEEIGKLIEAQVFIAYNKQNAR